MRKYLLQLFALFCLLAVQGNAQVPTAQLISPSPGGSGSVQRFTISTTGSDQGWTALMINNSYGWPQANGCNILVYPGGWIYLGDDNQASWGYSTRLGDPTYPPSISKGQCTLDSGTGSASQSGSTWTFAFTLTFKPAFAGTKYMSLGASTGGGAYNSPPSNVGTWTTTGGSSLPTTSLISPASGSTAGASQQVQFSATDSSGYSDIASSWFIITPNGGYSGTCPIRILPPSNSVQILNDAGTVWGTAVPIGSNTVLSNSQCNFNAASVSMVHVGSNTNNYAVTLNFASGFSGTKTMLGLSANLAGQYQTAFNLGSLTIPGGGSTATGGTGRMQLDLTTTPRTTIDNLNLQTILIPTDRNPQSSVNLYTATADNPSVLHFGDQFTVVIRNAKPNTQVWMFEVDFQPRPYPEPDDITIYPVLPNNGLLGVTNSVGYLMWNGTVSPTGGSHTLHLSVVNASSPPITTVNFDDGSDTPSINFIGAITFWAADQYNVPTPPVFQ